MWIYVQTYSAAGICLSLCMMTSHSMTIIILEYILVPNNTNP